MNKQEEDTTREQSQEEQNQSLMAEIQMMKDQRDLNNTGVAFYEILKRMIMFQEQLTSALNDMTTKIATQLNSLNQSLYEQNKLLLKNKK